ncbi:deoxyribose-phosphate aldolase [Amphibacillus marinus]|uniref:Deoxyribose-phosphate aldolase n=1 Tax=Amphibacillus marinus TaxID=872970 RepID=A0A1H8PI01_9BACI|nr:deoxyribose-phosphate aldolase [Amphibacillus marinus]SEO41354.1 deoxyribose-phosphate aldolase [Amphibacillus marinus]
MELTDLIEKLDYTLLKPTTTKSEMMTFCNETITYGFKVIFVHPYYLPYVCALVSEHDVKVGAPIGFSLGGATTKTKVFETQDAINNGAREIDMLINLGALKSKAYSMVKYDISEVVKASEGLLTKVIIETALLTEDEKKIAAQLIVEAGADFVKTSTGFNGGGATFDDVKLLRSIVGPDFGIKAAGGIRSYDDAIKMLELGADRLGTSGAVAIISGKTSTAEY